MKLLVFCIISATITYVLGAPQAVYDGDLYELRQIEDGNGVVDAEMIMVDGSSGMSQVRHRRVTCDVLSFQSKWISINDSACAIRCLTQRHKGGHCKDGVCVCRK